MSILRALGETPDEPVAVSELRKRVGERDSGKFNYHLGKLAGQFVRRTDDGYQLTIAGHRIVGAILAGTYTTDATLSPVEVDSPCPLCGGRLVAEYADEQARVHCTDCEEWANVVANATVQNMVPEGLLGRVTAVASSLSTVMMSAPSSGRRRVGRRLRGRDGRRRGRAAVHRGVRRGPAVAPVAAAGEPGRDRPGLSGERGGAATR